MADPAATSVIIPAFGEGLAVADVVAALTRSAPWKEVIVVDDGSADETGRHAAAAGARVIRHPYNKGNGASLKTGIRHASGEWILILDADGQHHPGDAVRLVSLLGEYDLVVGARSAQTQATSIRRWGNDLLNALASYLAERRIPDLTSGFRAARREHLLEFLHLLPNGFSTPTTTTLAFLRAGYNVRFEPIEARQRAGQSKIRLARDGAKFFLILLKVITIYSPLKIFVPISGGAFAVGVTYGVWTVLQNSRIPNGAVLLLMFAVMVFLVGLVSEQISTLRFESRGRTGQFEARLDAAGLKSRPPVPPSESHPPISPSEGRPPVASSEARSPILALEEPPADTAVQDRMSALVLVPTYNERDNLPLIVAGILAQAETRVLVIDDGSPDGTGEIADQLAREFPGRLSVMHRTGARGLGRSYLDGFRVALASNADFICQMDADLSHDPTFLPSLMAAATSGAGLVIGSRYMEGGRVENWPIHRVMLSGFANYYIRSVTGLRVRDCTSGFRCWRREALAQIPLDSIASDGYSFLVEVVFQAATVGLRIAEVPIVFVERRQGSSKLSGAVLIESLRTPWRLAFAHGRVRRSAGGMAGL